VNDQHGHAIDDLVLIKITELIKANIREIDLLARCGGKAVILWEEMGKCMTGAAGAGI
jgi:diguanylate cyclase (GGDEF)-like protein